MRRITWEFENPGRNNRRASHSVTLRGGSVVADPTTAKRRWNVPCLRRRFNLAALEQAAQEKRVDSLAAASASPN